MPQPSTTVYVVSNLPVTTFVNAEVEVTDGPEETLQARIASAVRHGMWKRAEGRDAEEYQDLDLEVNEALVDSRWEFDILPPIPPTPAIP